MPSSTGVTDLTTENPNQHLQDAIESGNAQLLKEAIKIANSDDLYSVDQQGRKSIFSLLLTCTAHENSAELMRLILEKDIENKKSTHRTCDVRAGTTSAEWHRKKGISPEDSILELLIIYYPDNPSLLKLIKHFSKKQGFNLLVPIHHPVAEISYLNTFCLFIRQCRANEYFEEIINHLAEITDNIGILKSYQEQLQAYNGRSKAQPQVCNKCFEKKIERLEVQKSKTPNVEKYEKQAQSAVSKTSGAKKAPTTADKLKLAMIVNIIFFISSFSATLALLCIYKNTHRLENEHRLFRLLFALIFLSLIISLPIIITFISSYIIEHKETQNTNNPPFISEEKSPPPSYTEATDGAAQVAAQVGNPSEKKDIKLQ
ncbi:MAG: hypothetical protein OEY79_00565 [Anaplasmataceae bacterium]|nr:hypothetical protein [Anaplasmataceae bacterium]